MKIINSLLPVLLLFSASLACGPGGERPPLVFSPPELSDARVGQPYEVTITVSGNETPLYYIALADSDLPPGLTLQYDEHEGSARIEGIPEASGEFAFTVNAACLGTMRNGQTGEQRYMLLIEEE